MQIRRPKLVHKSYRTVKVAEFSPGNVFLNSQWFFLFFFLKNVQQTTVLPQNRTTARSRNFKFRFFSRGTFEQLNFETTFIFFFYTEFRVKRRDTLGIVLRLQSVFKLNDIVSYRYVAIFPFGFRTALLPLKNVRIFRSVVRPEILFKAIASKRRILFYDYFLRGGPALEFRTFRTRNSAV